MSTSFKRPDNSMTIGQRVSAMFSKFDFRVTPLFMFFLFVLTSGAIANAYAMSFFFPVWLSVLLSGFMEGSTMAWKIADERPKNSPAQKDLTLYLVWVNVASFGLLMVANLVRAALHGNETTTILSSWDVFGFVLMGISALTLIAGFIVYREWDTDLKNRRALAQKLADEEHQNNWTSMVISSTKARFESRRKVYEELRGIETQYRQSGIPEKEISMLLKDAKNALELKYDVDADGDGKIGPVRREVSAFASSTRFLPTEEAAPKNLRMGSEDEI